MTDAYNPHTQSASRLKSCALFALGSALLVVALVTVFIINNRPPNISIPTPKVPVDNGYDYFVRAGNMIVGTGPMSSANKLPSAWTTPELAKFAHDNAAALTVLRQGLTKPYLCPPTRSFNTNYPEYAHFRETARTLLGESMYYEAIGDYAGAVDSRLDCIELGATMPRGGVLITALVGVAVEAIGEYDTNRLLPKLDATELAVAARRLERIQGRRAPFADTMQEEAYSNVAGLCEALRDPSYLKATVNPVAWFRGGPFGYSPSGSSTVPAEIFANAKYAFANKTAMVRSVRDYLLALAAEQRRQPYGVKSSVPVPQNYLAQIMLPMYDRARCAMEKSNAVTTLLQTEVALRRYRLDHGAYPSTLPVLTPVYLKKMPTDPFGLGKPLRYKPLDGGKGFLLYSLGPNLKDDGGASGSHQNSFQTGDIVAGKF